MLSRLAEKFGVFSKADNTSNENIEILTFAKDRDLAKLKRALENGMDPDQAVKLPDSIVRNGVFLEGRPLLAPLSVAAILGEVDALDVLLQAGAKVDNAPGDEGFTALRWVLTSVPHNRNVHRCIEKLIAGGANVNVADCFGLTPLMVASMQGDNRSASVLLRAGAIPDSRDKDGETPLTAAAFRGNQSLVEMLLKSGANINAKSHAIGRTALMSAAAKDDCLMVSMLIDNAVDLNVKATDAVTALNLAASQGSSRAVAILLKAGADPETADQGGLTPLMSATLAGYEGCVRALKEGGADLNTKTEWGSALTIAAHAGNSRMVALLLSLGAHVDACCPKGFTPLMKAASSNHCGVVRMLLKAGAAPKATSNEGYTALLLAASTGNAKTVEFLLDGGSDTNAVKDGFGAVIAAATGGNIAALRVLLKAGADRMQRGPGGRLAIHYAAEFGHIGAVSFLIDSGIDPNVATEAGETALMFAARRGGKAVIEVLLRQGAAINVRTPDGFTALMISCTEPAIEGVVPLLQSGADIHARTSGEQQTALMFAASSGHRSAIVELIKIGAWVDELDVKNTTAMMFAAEMGHLEVVKILGTAMRRVVGHQTTDGWTALMYAAANGHSNVVTYLLSQVLDIESQDNLGMTALMHAVVNEHSEPIKALIAARANIDIQNKEGYTALMLAAEAGSLTMMDLLLNAGACISQKNGMGMDALMLAAKRGSRECVQRLIKGGADVNCVRLDGTTALMEAASQGHFAVCEALINAAAPLDEADEAGVTALMKAAKLADRNTIGLLIRHHANFGATDREGRTALAHAAESGHQEAAEDLQLGYIRVGRELTARESALLTSKGYAMIVPTNSESRSSATDAAGISLTPVSGNLDPGDALAVDDLNARKQRLTEAEFDRKLLLDENAALRVRTDRLESDQRSLKDRLATLQSAREAQEVRIENDESHLRTLQHALDQAVVQRETKEAELVALRTQLVGLNASSKTFQDLVARQKALEDEVAALTRQNEELAQRKANLKTRLRLQREEKESLLAKIPQAATLPAEQVKLTLAKLDLESKRKQLAQGLSSAAGPSASKQAKELDAEEKRLREWEERLSRQVKIYEAFVSPPRLLAFNHFLEGLKVPVELNQRMQNRPNVYVSYAWEDRTIPEGEARHQLLQAKLKFLQASLESLGFHAFFDVCDMDGDLNDCMQQSIASSRYVILIGTEQLQQRIAKYPSSPAAFEYGLIMTKNAKEPQSLIPLMLGGKYETAFPPGVTKRFVSDLVATEQAWKSVWPKRLAQLGLTDPSQPNAGLIPRLLGLTGVERHTVAYGLYERALEHFHLRLDRIEVEAEVTARVIS